MDNDRFRKNIIKVLIAFSVAFLILIGYLSYFAISQGEIIISSQYNRRNRDKENDVLRGSIYDRNMELVVDSVRLEDNSQKRVYKKGYEQAYAPIVGYYSTRYGVAGIEAYYSAELLSAGMNPFKMMRDVLTKAERKGNNLVLTVDSDLQRAAYNSLKGYKGAVIAMDPRTGEVLCMASRPVFNPLTVDRDWDKLEEGSLLNRAIQSKFYPPGSTFKVVVASKAIEKINGMESKEYTCTGDLKIGNYNLSDYGDERHGKIGLHEALVESCNVTFGQIGMELGVERLKAGAEAFYFNRDIPFDGYARWPVARSSFPDIKESRQDSLAQSSIGQHEVTATPLQMLLVASAVANKGVIMEPFVVKAVTDSYGWSVKETKPNTLARPISEGTAGLVKKMMVDVVKRGTGKKAAISGIEVAGKTGTAEVGENVPSHSWFICFAPADNPKIAMAILVENGETGGGKAASIAHDLIASYLK